MNFYLWIWKIYYHSMKIFIFPIPLIASINIIIRMEVNKKNLSPTVNHIFIIYVVVSWMWENKNKDLIFLWIEGENFEWNSLFLRDLIWWYKFDFLIKEKELNFFTSGQFFWFASWRSNATGSWNIKSHYFQFLIRFRFKYNNVCFLRSN